MSFCLFHASPVPFFKLEGVDKSCTDKPNIPTVSPPAVNGGTRHGGVLPKPPRPHDQISSGNFFPIEGIIIYPGGMDLYEA